MSILPLHFMSFRSECVLQSPAMLHKYQIAQGFRCLTNLREDRLENCPKQENADGIEHFGTNENFLGSFEGPSAMPEEPTVASIN